MELLALVDNESLLVQQIIDLLLVTIQNIDCFEHGTFVVLRNQLLNLVPLGSYQILKRHVVLLGLLLLLLI